MPKYSKCKDCGTEDPALLYASGKMWRCHDCQHYDNLSKKSTGGGVEFSREEFVAWRRPDPACCRCSYRGIDGQQLINLRVVNVRTKSPYEVVGVDRMDNSRPYSLDNIVSYCGPCNAIKGGILTHAEMKQLGPVLRKVWDLRLGLAAGQQGHAADRPQAADGQRR